MHPDLAMLVVLQTHDLEAKRLRDQMASLTKQIAALETKARATVGQRAVILDLIAKEEALRRKEELETADLRTKLERNKKKLDMTTTTHQLEALEHEAAFLRSEITRIEDQELESMERGEALDAQLALANAAVDESADTLERDRPRHSEAIARGKGTAIAEALHQQCTACQMMVRPQRWNDLRDNSADSESAHTIMNCENCGRMLFYDPARDSPTRKTVQSESIAAQIVRSSI